MTKSRLFAASLLAASALVAATPAQAQRVDRIVTFGDSYADDGNFFALAGINPATTVAYTTGRFSGGTNYVDTLGTILGVPIENFAIGGARAGIGNQSNPFSWGFTYEVDQFLGVGTQSPVFPAIGTFNEGDLVTVSIGGNDSRAYQLGGGTVAGAPAVATVAAGQATANLDRLVAAGAPTISFLAGDTGLLPEVGFQPNPATAAAVRSAFSTTFNTAMQSTLSGYAANGVMVHYLDLTSVLGSITANLPGYGLSALACPAFPAPLGPGVPGSPACIAGPTDAFLVYGDELHLTSAGFAIVARYVAAQLTAPLTLQAASDMELDVAHQWGRTLTSRLDTGAPRDGDMPEGIKVFVVGDGYSRHQNASQTSENYRSSGVGGTLGAEYGFGSGVAGIAVNYTKPKINFGNDAADNKGHSIQLGAYGGMGIAGGFVQGYAGYGWDKNKIKRAGVVENMDANPKGHHFVAGAKGGYLMPLGAVRVGPVIALDYAKAKVNGYTEDGDPALTLHVDPLNYKSLRGSAGLEVRGDFAGGGVQLRPFAAVVAEKDFTGDSRTVHFYQTSAPTIVNSFAFEDASKKVYARVTGGFSAAIFSTVSLDVNASTTIGKDQGDETSAQLGFRVGF
jgi:uncharacterized protein YhjY with autotransporter beta-barrel domain/phospholipase/lecithinase/hemolysin